jgi:mono/diheme cytochrome c family protein
MLAALALTAPPAGGADTKETMERGRRVFAQVAQPSCALCHTFGAAGAVGKIGPSLDELRPDAAKVREAVMKGVGVMPSFAGKLSPEDIEAVSQYVAKSIAN